MADPILAVGLAGASVVRALRDEAASLRDEMRALIKSVQQVDVAGLIEACSWEAAGAPEGSPERSDALAGLLTSFGAKLVELDAALDGRLAAMEQAVQEYCRARRSGETPEVDHPGLCREPTGFDGQACPSCPGTPPLPEEDAGSLAAGWARRGAGSEPPTPVKATTVAELPRSFTGELPPRDATQQPSMPVAPTGESSCPGTPREKVPALEREDLEALNRLVFVLRDTVAAAGPAARAMQGPARLVFGLEALQRMLVVHEHQCKKLSEATASAKVRTNPVTGQKMCIV